MSENFTRDHKLVEEITSKGWFANPAGRQGYEVILLEQVGDGGTRFYHNLKPGETLRASERLFGKFIARAVDVRHARSFSIDKDFPVRERGRKIGVRANVRYRVTDARIVAMEALDPLGELRDKVIATLNREMMNHSEESVTPALVERIIRSVGTVAHLGLLVEDAEIIEFRQDPRVTKQIIEKEDLQHDISVGGIKQKAELEAESLSREKKIQWEQDEIAAINLADINVLLHRNPDLIPQVFDMFSQRDMQLLSARIDVIRPVIDAYVRQQIENDEDIDPAEIARIMHEAISPARPQLRGGSISQIIWGDENVIDVLPEGDNNIKFTDYEAKQPPEDKKPTYDDDEDDEADPSRIKFG